MIELRDVTKEFRAENDDVFAVRDVSLSVPKGAFVAVMGRSGSGKSTLLNLVAGLERPTSGSVQVAGRDLAAMDDAALTAFRRDEIGVVFQFFNLLPTLTVAENVALPARLAGKGNGVDDRVRRLLEQVDLSHRAAFRPHRLSGGEMQRAAVARALVNDPRLLLADEPTGNLDTHYADRVLRDLRAAADERGCTVLLVTHSPDAARWADRCLWMQDGCLREDGE
ncbi:MAG TPA: ABC transporter ATP-binding protein [Armatimonadota bacterium]|jgi:ABC-type lipoprotein export system ATPase subunit